MKKIQIKLLADCPEFIPFLAQLWYDNIGKQWVPDTNIAQAEQKFIKHMNREKLPMMFVAFDGDQPVGMASLRENDGIQPERTPWLGGVVVDPIHRQQKIGEQLVDAVKQRAFVLGYQKLYLLAFDPTIPDWYKKLDWQFIGTDRLLSHEVTVMDFDL